MKDEISVIPKQRMYSLTFEVYFLQPLMINFTSVDTCPTLLHRSLLPSARRPAEQMALRAGSGVTATGSANWFSSTAVPVGE
jgi:hypothetical protein